MKGYDLAGKYKYDLSTKKKLGNYSEVKKMADMHAKKLKKRNMLVIVTRNKAENTLSVWVQK